MKLLRIIFGIILFFLISACQNISNNNVDSASSDLKIAIINTKLGIAYLENGYRARAKQKLLLAMQKAPSSSTVNDALAYFYEQTGDSISAKKYYLQAISLSPSQGEPLNNYGAFLCREEHYQQAEYYFLKAVMDKTYINSAKAYENAGLCSVSAQSFKAAQNYFQQALQQNPHLPESLYQLSKLNYEQGNNTIAADYFMQLEEIVKLNKRYASLGYKIAKKSNDTAKLHQYEVLLG